MSRPIRITHIIYRLAIGGMENGLVNLVNGMDRRFVHQIISLTDATEFQQRISNEQVQIVTLHKKPGKDIGFYVRLFKNIRAFKPDIVHTRNFGTVDCGLIARLANVSTLIHSEHGWDVGDLDGSNSRYIRMRRWLSKLANIYLAVSQDIKHWLQHQVGVAPKKLAQIYNGVNAQKFYPSDDQSDAALRVGFVGRLEAVKNPMSLLKAIKICHAREDLQRPIELVVVGNGSSEAQMREAVDAWGMQDSVSFLGARSDVAELMRTFSVFALPSFNEGISNTILEAMASGLPVVAAEVGGNPELVAHGVNGVLYQSDDEQAISEALIAYANDEQLRKAHGIESRHRVERQFSLTAMISSYEQLYQASLGSAVLGS